jgi:hypothetical protein
VIELFVFLLGVTTNAEERCPNLSGLFQCPPYQTQPEYVLRVTQKDLGNGITQYTHYFTFADVTDVTTASPSGVGTDGRCEGGKVLYGNTHNYVLENGNYAASRNGVQVIECSRFAIPAPAAENK